MSATETRTTSSMTLQELDSRDTKTELIQLFWLPASNRIFVRITDKQYNICRNYIVPNHKARDAFWHPYAYAD